MPSSSTPSRARSACSFPSRCSANLRRPSELGARVGENRLVLDDFLAETYVDVIDATASVARHYGRMFAALKRAGTPVPVNDLWIAAATLDCGGTLLTFDRDFERIDGMDRMVLTPREG